MIKNLVSTKMSQAVVCVKTALDTTTATKHPACTVKIFGSASTVKFASTET